MRLVSAVEAGGLQVGAVDLIPLALTRALARPVPAMALAGRWRRRARRRSGRRRGHRVVRRRGDRDRRARGRCAAVRARARQRRPRAHRRDRARPRRPGRDRGGVEARARQPGATTRWSRGRAPSVDRPLSVLLDEVRSSIDYYRNQPGSARLRRVVVTGGSAQLPGLPERLSALVGVPVEPAYMHDLIRIGDIGFAPDELPRLEPYLPAAVGLALGGAERRHGHRPVAAHPAHRRRSVRPRIEREDRRSRSRRASCCSAASPTWRTASPSSAKSKQAAAETEALKLKNQLGHLLQGSAPVGQQCEPRRPGATVLGTDIAGRTWSTNFGISLPGGRVAHVAAGTAHTRATARDRDVRVVDRHEQHRWYERLDGHEWRDGLDGGRDGHVDRRSSRPPP